MRTLLALLLLLGAQQIGAQDVDKILERADKLLDESKAAYEEARSKSSVPGFVDAGFKLEEARIKYIVIQEIGSADKQKVAADRLRAVNQLSKLIHDGKVAINGTPADAPAPKPADPAAPAADAPKPADAPPKVVDVRARATVPDAARQKEAEKLVKELFKDQYARKAPADRQALARSLLDHGRKAGDDPAAAWVLLREAQDIAVQTADIATALAAIEAAAGLFDVDAMALKSAALTAATKTARLPAEFTALAEALLKITVDFVAADQYDPAEKAAATALASARRANDVLLTAKAATRSKEVAEAKTKFQSLKKVLETLARNPDDPAANLEMGQFLCFMKGNWDLGLRFLTKGSDPVLKALVEKELSFPAAVADRVAIADGWWDFAQKESSALRKGQILAHAWLLYEAVLPEVTGLVRIKVDKRLEGYYQNLPGGPAIDLLKLIDAKRDLLTGEWKMENGVLTVFPGKQAIWLHVPYSPPDEYDLRVVAARRAGFQDLYMGIVAGGRQVNTHVDAGNGSEGGIDSIDGKGWTTNECHYTNNKLFVDDRPHTIVISIRKGSIVVAGDGRPLIRWKGDFKRLTPCSPTPNASALYLGTWETGYDITQMMLFPVSGQGRKLDHLR